MRIWRVARKPFAALDGEGARQFGARWSSEGVAVVYAASHLSLSALEYLVHIDPGDVPDDLVALSIDVPDDAAVIVVTPDDLPAGWRETPPRAACQRIGNDWVADGKALLLRLPSVLVPEESNVLVNPAHPRAREVRVARTRPFVYDTRLLKRG
ncbi:MAG: RES family NAD+ phosphorylase [Gemmatimonadetes bacterium]|nr:RES family NAD+ phosphorylase [Gemmatimonadota bacterium]